jgi:hypothetical protein
MKNLFAAFALTITLIACNSQPSQETQETQTDSTAVQVDSCAADSTCKDTCKTSK